MHGGSLTVQRRDAQHRDHSCAAPTLSGRRAQFALAKTKRPRPVDTVPEMTASVADEPQLAVRLGAAKVNVLYRRTETEMPARVEEVHHARQEGIEFHLLQSPKRVLGDERGRVRGIECLKFELGEPDDSGRRRPVPMEGSEFTMELDTVIVAIGNKPNPLIPQTMPELEMTKWGTIVVDEETMLTSVPGVFAGGDIVSGAATVILAMGQGRIAAAAMNDYLNKKQDS